MITRVSGQRGSKPSSFHGIGLIVRRELGLYFKTRNGYIIAALTLLMIGLFFNVHAIGSTSRYSAEVLSDFFYDASGWLMGAAVLLSMRLIAEERQAGTMPLLSSSSLTDGEIVFAKFLSGFLFLAALTAVTSYMPALIFVRGKVSLGHIAAGYLGLLLLGASVVAIGTFGSAIAPSQVVASVISGSITVLLLLLWLLARVVDGPLGEIAGYLSLHNKHFQPFMRGTVSLKDVVFYLSISAFFLVLARNSLERRRWTP